MTGTPQVSIQPFVLTFDVTNHLLIASQSYLRSGERHSRMRTDVGPATTAVANFGGVLSQRKIEPRLLRLAIDAEDVDALI